MSFWMACGLTFYLRHSLGALGHIGYNQSLVVEITSFLTNQITTMCGFLSVPADVFAEVSVVFSVVVSVGVSVIVSVDIFGPGVNSHLSNSSCLEADLVI